MHPSDDPTRHDFDQEPDPQLGGLDEEVWAQRKIEKDPTLSARERYRARITGRAVAHSVYVITGKIIAGITFAVFTARAARRVIATTAAVGAATSAVAITGALTTVPHVTPAPEPTASVGPTAPAHRPHPAGTGQPATTANRPVGIGSTIEPTANKTTSSGSADPAKETPHPGRISGPTLAATPEKSVRAQTQESHTRAPQPEPTQKTPTPTLTQAPILVPTAAPTNAATARITLPPSLKSAIPPSLLPSLEARLAPLGIGFP